MRVGRSRLRRLGARPSSAAKIAHRNRIGTRAYDERGIARTSDYQPCLRAANLLVHAHFGSWPIAIPSLVEGTLTPIWSIIAFAASTWIAAQGVQIPAPPRGFSPTEADMVVDAANVLSPDAVARINRIIFDVKQKSGGEIVVVTLPDIGQRDVGDVALNIGRQWKVGANANIGDRARNAGLVILVVPKESSSDGRGHISIQTGQGTEGFVTDAMAGDMRREAIPYFQRQDYSSALELLTLRVGQRFASEFGFQLDTALVPANLVVRERPSREIPPQALGLVLLLLLIFFSAMGNAARRGRGRGRGCWTALAVADVISHSRGRGGWGGGGFGGGGFGGGGGGGFGGFGGGGGFSGGGSSGSW
jgi:uncharacterized protein